MNKSWKDLKFMKQIVIKPEDPKQPMSVDFTDDAQWQYFDYPISPREINRERSIKLGANTMFTIEMDYPETFKRLVVATGDIEEAFRLYNHIQKEAPNNWFEHDTNARVGDVW